MVVFDVCIPNNAYNMWTTQSQGRKKEKKKPTLKSTENKNKRNQPSK